MQSQLSVRLVKAIGVTVSEVLPDNPQRRYALLVNQSLNTIDLSLGDVTVTSGAGIRLNASGGSYEINTTNPWKGRIYAIASGADSDLGITEY